MIPYQVYWKELNAGEIFKKMTLKEVYSKAYASQKRLPELEFIILTDPRYSYYYAEYVIKGRWIEAEDIIMSDPDIAYFYAVNVIKGKLPDKMHNMMLLHAIKDSNKISVKEYFEFIECTPFQQAGWQGCGLRP